MSSRAGATDATRLYPDHQPPATPLRLLITADAVGGVWDYAVMLCSQLATAHGLDICLVSMGPLPTAAQLEATRRIPGLTLIPTSYALEWMPDSLPQIQEAGLFLRTLVADYRPHVVHFNQHCFGSLDLAVPSVVVSHSDSLSWHHAQWGAIDMNSGWQGYHDLIQRGLRGATAVVAPTRYVADYLRALYVPHLPVRVIHNGAALADGACPPPGRAARPIDVMAAGRVWDSAKNLLLVGQAAALLGPGYRVEIAGGLHAPHGGQVPVEHLPGTRFLGQIARRDLHARMGQAKVFVAPARYEPFGLSLVEAALAGCALVVSDIPSFREVWAETATYISGTDAGELAGVLATLLADDQRRACQAQAARRRALERYGVATMAAAYLALYHDLIRPDFRALDSESPGEKRDHG